MAQKRGIEGPEQKNSMATAHSRLNAYYVWSISEGDDWRIMNKHPVHNACVCLAVIYSEYLQSQAIQ
jgi:hypothetical protein